jgi:hypothetical protein
MQLVEGRIGDPGTFYPYYWLFTERVYVGDLTRGSKVFLRGFQVTHQNESDHNLKRFEVVVDGFTSALNPGYFFVTAEVWLHDDQPDALVVPLPGADPTIKGEEDVSFVVDYTILVL